MSYDVSYHPSDDPDEELFSRNYTSNLAPLWRELGCDIAEFDGKSCREFAANLRPAVAELATNLRRYRSYDSPNGWGSADGVLTFLADLLAAADETPDAIVRVWR